MAVGRGDTEEGEMNTRRTVMGLAGLAVLSLVAAGCTSSGGASPSPSSAGSTVDVTLQEWAVGVVPATAPAGDVTFTVTN